MYISIELSTAILQSTDQWQLGLEQDHRLQYHPFPKQCLYYVEPAHKQHSLLGVFEFYPLQISKQVWITCMIQVREDSTKISHATKRFNHSPTPDQNLTKFIRGCDYICRDARIKICIHNSQRIQLWNMVPPNLQGVPEERHTYRKRKRGEGRIVTPKNSMDNQGGKIGTERVWKPPERWQGQKDTEQC